MLDPRVYRAAFVPALLALALAAFSLRDRERPVSVDLPAAAFDGARAFSAAAGSGGLRDLARRHPDRRPGSPGDESLADRMARGFAASGLTVRRRVARGETTTGPASLETVEGLRVGVSSRRIVVMAHRDALSSPATAELSGTAALLELARVLETRTLSRTLVLVSTSGGSGGSAGARAYAAVAGARVDAVLVLGDLAGTRVRKPWLVPWSNGPTPPSLALRRTLEVAVRTEVGSDPGGLRAAAQWARLAAPLTLGEQGELNRGGLPAVLLQVSGERGPAADQAVSAARLQEFGRAALRGVLTLDVAPREVLSADRSLVLRRRVVPDWAVRLLVGALLLPIGLAALDGVVRSARRGGRPVAWMGWSLANAVPFALVLAWALGLELSGVVSAPPAPFAPGAVPLDAAGVAALVSLPVVAALGWSLVRRVLLSAFGATGDPAEGGAAAVLVAVLALALGAVWVVNPFLALLLVPAGHLWLLVAVGGPRLRGVGAFAALSAGLVLPALLLLSYATTFDAGPVQGAWWALLLVAGGTVSVQAALAGCLLGGCLAGATVIVARRRGEARGPQQLATRGPASYAGPGSLGGTRSALRE